MKYLINLFILAQSFSRYHPSKGYWWQFKDGAEAGNVYMYTFHDVQSTTRIKSETLIPITCTCMTLHFV